MPKDCGGKVAIGCGIGFGGLFLGGLMGLITKIVSYNVKRDTNCADICTTEQEQNADSESTEDAVIAGLVVVFLLYLSMLLLVFMKCKSSASEKKLLLENENEESGNTGLTISVFSKVKGGFSYVASKASTLFCGADQDTQPTVIEKNSSSEEETLTVV